MSTVTAPSPPDAIRVARRTLLRGEPVRMQEVAAALGVSRVTLHRWVGSREQLLSEVLWSLAAGNLAAALSATRKRGGEKIADAMARFVTTVQAEPGMRAFLEREPELALRILTTNASAVQARSVEAVRELLEVAESEGDIQLPMPAADLAYVIVRITESFLYADLITGDPPDAEKARRAVAALLR
jgi:AcrR family transcriptional regulator